MFMTFQGYIIFTPPYQQIFVEVSIFIDFFYQCNVSLAKNILQNFPTSIYFGNELVIRNCFDQLHWALMGKLNFVAIFNK